MITGIAIENFKGIQERVELELKPLTLLFGPNSAGKSTILHALHYAREVFERHNLDADRTLTGGDFVDLGGFGGFVHGHDKNLVVKLAFELDLEDVAVPDYAILAMPGVPIENPEPLVGEIQSAVVEIAVAWSRRDRHPYVRDYTVTINGKWFASIDTEPGRKGAYLKFDSDHPVLVRASDHEVFADQLSDVEIESALFRLWDNLAFRGVLPHLESGDIPLPGHQDSLPQWGHQLTLDWNTPSGVRGLRDVIRRREEINQIEDTVDWIERTLSQLVVGPGQLLHDALLGFRYLGPLRKTLPRLYSPPRFPDPSRWASGLGAWDVLFGGDEKLVQQVNDWLSESERLDTGYRVLLQNYKELDLKDPLVVQLLTGRAFDEADDARLDLESLPTQSRLIIVPNGSSLELQPHDVGIGISQIVPVVVTALDATPGLSAIEQPELHVHPRVQAEMGDLFIEAALERKRSFLIETHSEHLVLRLQRRIRQTGKGEPHKGIPITGNDVAVYFVNQEDGQTKIRRIDIDKNGEFIQPWPDDFFEVDFYERFQ